jgi:cytochrome b involved in lipid metabolism
MATKEYTLSEVATHKSRDDLWIVVQGNGKPLNTTIYVRAIYTDIDSLQCH